MQPPPYMMSVKNVPAMFAKIKTAGTPPKFTVEFLKSSLGFASSGDRGIVAQLKYLKFLTEDGTPTDRYNQYKGTGGNAVLGLGIKEGYSEVFMADQEADTKTTQQLTEMFRSLTGKGDTVALKMATTFKAICNLADFSTSEEQPAIPVTKDLEEINSKKENEATRTISQQPPLSLGGSSLTLRHDVHVHLPATSDVAVYKAIFRAINDELAD
ncbi:MAG TPA: DUF5343 domain-containing protein [Candidatus Microsaccharimonas sp.]|jgi:hypothetical protein